MVADTLAKNGQGLSLHSTQWWPAPPPFITSLLLRDRQGLPCTRIVMVLFYLGFRVSNIDYV
jgi:hypothetical protein